MTVLAEVGHVVLWAVVFWVVSHVLDGVLGYYQLRCAMRAWDRGRR